MCKNKRRLYAILMFGIFSLYILFVSLNNILASNFIFSGMMLVEITEWLYQALELIAFFISYAVAIYTVFKGGWRGALPYAGIYSAGIGVRYVVLILLDWLFFGLKSENIPIALLFMSINILLELMQYALVFVIALLTVHVFDQKVDIMQKGAARLKDISVARDQLIFPYRKISIKNDPLRLSALLTAVFVGAKGVISRLISDISFSSINPSIGGAPKGLIDALWMIFYYSFDILIGVACYFVVLAIIKKLALPEKAR
jgi:hypothetical protein